MKRTYDSSRYIAFFVKAGLVAALAAVLLAPTSIKVSGSEAQPRVDHAWPMLKRGSFDALPLPPIPYLETMPWLVRERTPTGFKIDTLLGPKFELMQAEVAGGAPLLPSSKAQSADEAGHASL
jgi:hypothetical protein